MNVAECSLSVLRLCWLRPLPPKRWQSSVGCESPYGVIFLRRFQSPFLRHPPLASWYSLPPLSKIFVSPSLFSVPPLLKVFQAPSLHATPCYPKLIDQPSLHIINRFKQISKGQFYHLNCHFLSKVNFWFPSKTYQVILIYGIFSSSFLDNLDWLFFIKLSNY